MQTTSLGLGELLRRAKEGSLTIPQFQRSFIWKESQVKLLIDSMSRSYPIGSLLLLDKKPDLPLASRNIEAEIRDGFPPDDLLGNDTHESKDQVESYILDGQQRTTSIARVFLDAHPKKAYYFDLKEMLENHENEETSYIRTRARGKKEQDRKDNNRLLRADVILDQQKTDIYVTEYIEDSGDFSDFDQQQNRRAAARIKGIFEKMRNYKVSVVNLERDSGVESVCRVFETINSTGTRLTTFDLAVARFYPKPDLRSLWDSAQEHFPTLQHFDVDGERVLQILCLLDSARNERYPDVTRSNILALRPADIEREWLESSRALAEAYEWARRYGARPETLPNHNVLVAWAAVRRLFSDREPSEIWSDHDFIRRWYFSKILQGGVSQASNYRIGMDFNALHEYAKSGTKMSVQEVNLDAQIILKLKRSDVRYKALQNVFGTTVKQDLVSGYMIDSNSVLHDHHIYPRAARKQLPVDMLDSICNRLPLLDKSNQHLGEGYPQEYLGELALKSKEEGTLSGLARRLDDCMIPGDPSRDDWENDFSIENFERFCRGRAELIVRRVREIVGDSLRSTPASEDELIEDEE